MKYLFGTIITLLVFSFGTDAQEKESKWRMGFNYSLEENKSSNILPTTNETPFPLGGNYAKFDRPNYRLGIEAEYQFIKKLSLNSSINYSSKDFSCSSCAGSLPGTYFSFRFIEVPVTFRYDLNQTKFRPFVELGVNNYFLLHKRSRILRMNSSKYINKQNTYGLGMILGTGFEYSLTNDFALQFNLDYNTGNKNIFENAEYNLKSFGYGIGFKSRL